MAALARYVVGIDLGTTHTVVAYADTAVASGTVPEVRAFDLEQLVGPGEVAARSMLPSARYHPADGELSPEARSLPWGSDDEESAVVGQLALDLGARVPGRLVTSAKSWLSHAAVDRTAAILPWGAPDEIPKISPVGASASYLRHVRAAWDARFPDAPLATQEVVLTVPASFDEGARALTLRAAKDAGLPRVRLVEEPQAAVYFWLDRHRETLEDALSGVRLALVIDVGGGTTDLTLVRIELRESGPRLTRIAVGEHLMLGGDNMDLALARRAEERLSKGSPLGTARFSQLVQQSRAAKERLLGVAPPDKARITVLGSGSKLIGGAISTELERSEVNELVLDGFFPSVGPDERPQKRRGGIVEFGLPYAADPAITRHVAEFLSRHESLAREALGETAPSEGALPVADAILFNGGVFRSPILADRMLDVLGRWRGDRPRVLANEVPELAVARGAVAYGLARRGLGLRIAGGSARSYFLIVDRKEGGERHGVCVLPRGTEESEEIELKDRTFSLRLGQPVRFHLVSSTADVRYVRAGDLVALEDGDRYTDLPPIAAVLEDARGEAREIPVHLLTGLTEVGTLELSCREIAEDRPGHVWKLEFQLRGTSGDGPSAARIAQLHPRFGEATEKIRRVYGKSAQEVSPREVKGLRSELEKILGPRESWNTPLLRELFGALFAGAKRRRRSADHERIWFNLVGYTLRPGYGYPLDSWRVKQLDEIYDASVQFVTEAQNWSEFWTLFRRIAGGIEAKLQEKIAADLAWYLEPPSKKPRPRPTGPKKLGYDDMVRLVGALERLSAARKATLGGFLVERLVHHGESETSWWAVGRLGARVPFYGSAHEVVPAAVATEWLRRCLARTWNEAGHPAFAATLLARASGDRQRDLDPDLRNEVATRLEKARAPASWVQMVREVTHLEAADERRIFGDALPPGLRMVDA